MATLSHPDQSRDAIQRARCGATKNAAPPRGVNFVSESIDLGVEPEKPKSGQPGYEYPKAARPTFSKEQLFAAMKDLGLDSSELQASIDGLMTQNTALIEENAQLKARVAAMESASRVQPVPQEDIADAEFENVPQNTEGD